MAHHQACPPIAVSKVIGLLPAKFLTTLEQNQKIASCCRHPENHTIEALFSNEAERDKGVPDIYIFRCTCGRSHPRLMVGASEGNGRPFWEVH